MPRYSDQETRSIFRHFGDKLQQIDQQSRSVPIGVIRWTPGRRGRHDPRHGTRPHARAHCFGSHVLLRVGLPGRQCRGGRHVPDGRAGVPLRAGRRHSGRLDTTVGGAVAARTRTRTCRRHRTADAGGSILLPLHQHPARGTRGAVRRHHRDEPCGDRCARFGVPGRTAGCPADLGPGSGCARRSRCLRRPPDRPAWRRPGSAPAVRRVTRIGGRRGVPTTVLRRRGLSRRQHRAERRRPRSHARAGRALALGDPQRCTRGGSRRCGGAGERHPHGVAVCARHQPARRRRGGDAVLSDSRGCGSVVVGAARRARRRGYRHRHRGGRRSVLAQRPSGAILTPAGTRRSRWRRPTAGSSRSGPSCRRGPGAACPCL